MLPVNGVVHGPREDAAPRRWARTTCWSWRSAGDAGEIRADRGQLEQVLVNLMLNARDAMAGRGRVTIATRATVLDDGYAAQHDGIGIPRGEYVQLAVSDTGIGMDRETQARIFEPFFTTKPVGQGTGLGLSTVYGIVKQSDGFVWVLQRARPGHDLQDLSPARRRRRRRCRLRADAGPAARGGSETILIVEDEEMVRSLASRGLREHGYTVIEARHGAEALRPARESASDVDLVISDVVMPEMGGRELGQRLASLRPSLPVLYMSGYTGEDVTQRGLLEPGAPFQQKPFAPGGAGAKGPGDARRGARSAPPRPAARRSTRRRRAGSPSAPGGTRGGPRAG